MSVNRRSWDRWALVVLALLALIVWVAWWLFSGLLSGSDHSACADSFSADVAVALSYLGLVLAVGALLEAFRTDRPRIGWALLGAYAIALAVTVAISLTCAEDDRDDDLVGNLGGGRVRDIPTLRACLEAAGARIATSAKDLDFPRETLVIYDGKLPDGASVRFWKGVGAHRFRLYFATQREKDSPGERVFEDPGAAAMAAYIYPERAETVEVAEECLPRMRNVGL